MPFVFTSEKLGSIECDAMLTAEKRGRRGASIKQASSGPRKYDIFFSVGNDPGRAYAEAFSAAEEYGCRSIAVAAAYGSDGNVEKSLSGAITDFLARSDALVYIATGRMPKRRGGAYAEVEKLLIGAADPEAVSEKKIQKHTVRFAGTASKMLGECAAPEAVAAACPNVCRIPDEDELSAYLEDGFALSLMKLIDKRGMDDVSCYKRANVSKQTWYKIMNDKNYRPSRNTVISFAIALELDFDQTQRLLRTAGYALSRSNKADVIIEYFISHGIYDIFEIDETLFRFDQVPLCSVRGE